MVHGDRATGRPLTGTSAVLPYSDRRLVLVAATLGSFVVLLDSTAVGVALPAISADLGGGLESQQWIVNAYLLTLGSLILIGGSLGDIFGERRMFVLGTAGFGVASAGCVVAQTIEALIAVRALQGAFGALLTPASLAVIVSAFPPDERSRAIGTWTAYSGIAAIVGPLAGGWLVDALSWRWIFAINVPVVFVSLALATRMTAVGTRRSRRPDWIGAALCAIGLAGTTFGLVRQPPHGWTDPFVAGSIVGGTAMLTFFVIWERRGTRDPMLPLGLFGRGNFAWGNVETLLIYGALGLLFFVLVVFLQQVAGYSALEAGAATIPTTVVMFLLSQRIGVLADRVGPRAFMAAGPVVSAAGVLYLVAMVDEAPGFLLDVLPGTTTFAVGLAIVVAPLTAAVLSDADEHDAGIASGVNNAVARVAGLLATAMVGTIAGGTLDLGGFRTTLAVTAGLLALAGAVGLAGIRNPRRCVPAGSCAGGQLVGAPSAVTETWAPPTQPLSATPSEQLFRPRASPTALADPRSKAHPETYDRRVTSDAGAGWPPF